VITGAVTPAGYGRPAFTLEHKFKAGDTMKNKFTASALLVLTGLSLCSATRAQSNVGGRLNRVIEDTEDTSVKPDKTSRPEANPFDRDRWRRRSETIRLKKESYVVRETNPPATRPYIAGDPTTATKRTPINEGQSPSSASSAATPGRTKSAPTLYPDGFASGDPKAATAPTSVGTVEVILNEITESGNAADPINLYRVGAGDVLDIRITNMRSGGHTLYPVLPGGVLEYPLAGTPLRVSGLTVDEISARIRTELRGRAIHDSPRVEVGVREYESHTVLVSGLVAEPGAKVIRREAVPLYVVIAAAQPLPDASRVQVASYATRQQTDVALDDRAAMNTLVRPGDVLVVSKERQQFYYIGGDAADSGQREFYYGITLTQAIMAAAGKPSRLRAAIVTRQGPDGFLVTTDYSLKDIMSGKVPDPRIRPGDRIEVRR
jgi:protein involved in polysaccharide export with SLBB domain